VVNEPGGEMKVDWEAYSRQGTVTPDGLVSGAAAGGEVRALVTRSRYYNYGFRDETRWLAFDLANSDWEQPLTGYAAIGTPTAAILQTLGSAEGPQRVVLEIAVEGDSGRHRQVVVKRVLAVGWVKGDRTPEAEFGEDPETDFLSPAEPGEVPRG
jgi:hypothetical protein